MGEHTCEKPSPQAVIEATLRKHFEYDLEADEAAALAHLLVLDLKIVGYGFSERVCEACDDR